MRSLFERLSADPIRISAASAPWLLHLLWATGYNTFAIPLAAGIGYSWGFLLSPAACAALISLSTVIVAINAKLLERARKLVARASAAA